jgi:hypothetical protein
VLPVHTGLLLPICVLPALIAATTLIVLVALEEEHPVTEYVIVTDPAETPVTTPLLFTVALLLLLLHVPPAVPLVLSVIVDPVHTADAPLIEPALAFAFTWITF